MIGVHSSVHSALMDETTGIRQARPTGRVCNRIGNGNLPPAFFSIPEPAGFTQLPLNGFNVTTLQGFKLYRLSQSWDKNFGTLSTNLGQPRKLQWSIKFIF